MTVPDSQTIIAWGTAIATLILIVRQQMNAMAGKQRGEDMQSSIDHTQCTVQTTKAKVEEIHTTTTNGQIEILKSRATALRTIANLRNTPSDIMAAQLAETDLAAYIKNTKGTT